MTIVPEHGKVYEEGGETAADHRELEPGSLVLVLDDTLLGVHIKACRRSELDWAAILLLLAQP